MPPSKTWPRFRRRCREAAKEHDQLRSNWLNPPEWTREEVLTFPGSVEGPWARYVENPNSLGIGTVRYRRLVALDEDCAKELAKRTLIGMGGEILADTLLRKFEAAEKERSAAAAN